MDICNNAPILDEVIEQWRVALGADLDAYRNHCYRVLNFSLALYPEGLAQETPDVLDKFSIAVAFHDLAIWTEQTFDYLAPSRRLAADYLTSKNLTSWRVEIEAMIENHHKISRYRAQPHWLVETFRRADWVDVTRGRRRFGLDKGFITEVLGHFPNAGFHRRLITLTKERLRRHPFSPLPMMRW